MGISPTLKRSVCIHGHFYQPPRENPWTGRIDRQESAGEFHDWNVRIEAECYAPNTAAQILDSEGHASRTVNNYSRMSFNIGPTLMMWLEKESPKTYARILEADSESQKKFPGHGNAIAQAFVHLILPLASLRDQKTVVRWGISDFKRRFGRTPESVWLPETACDEQTLRILIAEEMKYVILAPSQAESIRPMGSQGPWWNVSDSSIDPRRPYRWFDRSVKPARFIDIFFYDGPISAAVSFEKLMSDARVCADRLEGAFNGFEGTNSLASIATDGELYGHHHKFAEMGLAYLLEKELPQREIDVVNYGFFLSQNLPAWEVQIKAGPQGLGTSWSCSHGVGRWFLDCGCGSEGNSQKWRTPLRRAFDVLQSRLDATHLERGPSLLSRSWRQDAIVIHRTLA